MPAAKGIWRGGSDGIVECRGGNEYVPDGWSLWEMSNETHPSQKANRDYRNRINAPGPVDPASVTFVFATMRTWPGKQEWVSKRRQDKVFRDVKAFDCEDLWGWLETQPDVHSWLSDQMGFRPVISTAPMELIPDVRCFVGREEELETLKTAAGGRDGGVLVISGQPGIGKTALATRLAYDCMTDYPDGQLFVELRDTRGKAVPTEDALTHVLHSFGVVARDLASASDLAATYRTTLSRKRAIIVFDSAASEGQLRPLLPGASQCLVVVTSRNPLSALDPDVAVQLDVLERRHAVELLRGQTGHRDIDPDDPSVTAIAKACGGLPLALTVAARAGRRASWSLATLAQRLADERHRLDHLSLGDLGVRASFQLSYGLLRRTDRALFRRTTLIPGATFDAVLVAAASGLNDLRRVEGPIDRLVDLGLVLPTAPEGNYRLHDLLRLFGTEKSHSDGGPQEASETFDNVGRYLYRQANRAALALAGIAVADTGDAVRNAPGLRLTDRSDALKWFDRYVNNVISLVPTLVNVGKYDIVLNVIFAVTSYLELRGYGKNLENMAATGLAIITELRQDETVETGDLDQLEAVMLRYLSKAAIEDRRYDIALRYCREAEDKFDDASMRIDMGNVRGTIFLRLHRYDDALTEFRAVERSCEGDPDLSGVEALASYNIGVALHRLGRDAEAMPHLERDLQRCRAEKDQVGEGTTLNTIGNAFVNLGDVDSAIKALSLAVQRYEECGDVIHSGLALNDLGLAFTLADRHDEAIQCHTKDLAICSGANDLHGAGKACLRIAGNLIVSNVEKVESARTVLAHAKTLLDLSDTFARADLSMVEGEIAYAAHEHERGREEMDNAIAFYEAEGFHRDKAQVQLRHSHCLIEHGYPDLAIDLLNRTITAIDADNKLQRKSAENLLARARRSKADAGTEGNRCGENETPPNHLITETHALAPETE